jgi:uncharacterized membrane protein HdeD (DUF308 family)
MLVCTFCAILAIDYLLGIVLINMGIHLLTSGSTFLGEYKRTWRVIVLGIFAITVGVATFIVPAIMTISIVYLIAATSLINRFTDLILAISSKCCPVNGALVGFSGIHGIILGIQFIVLPSLVGAYVIVQITGIFLPTFGILAISAGFMAKKAVQTA